jgi:dTDP-4-amino-4,6-dideoxygalactose transaminase
VLSLPMFPELDDARIERVVGLLLEAVDAGA